jgi:hypothetical protein
MRGMEPDRNWPENSQKCSDFSNLKFTIENFIHLYYTTENSGLNLNVFFNRRDAEKGNRPRAFAIAASDEHDVRSFGGVRMTIAAEPTKKVTF